MRPLLLLLTLGLALPASGAPADDAKALYERALKADLTGDALAAQSLLLDLASRHPDTRYGRAARRRLGGGGATLFAASGIFAAIAIPAFMKYQRRAKTSEARMNIRRMFDGAVAFYMEEHADKDGKILPPRFPKTTKPTLLPCGEALQPRGFDQQGFQELNFKPSGPVRFQYQFISEGTGANAQFTARAIGDLDCDGNVSTFERIGIITDGEVNGGAGVFIKNELE